MTVIADALQKAIDEKRMTLKVLFGKEKRS